MKIEKEDFDAWLDNPITEKFLAHLKRYADAAEEEWLSNTFNSNMSGYDMELLRTELATRKNLIADILETRETHLNGETEDSE